MIRFPSSPLSSLVDVPVRYDLAESTSPALRVADVIEPDALAGLALDYGTSKGDAGLRALIAADTGVDPDQVLVTVGAAEALYLLAQDCAHGRVVVVTPVFPHALAVPVGLGATVDQVVTRFEDGYRLPLDGITAALRADTLLVSLASPQNPSGVRYTDDELLAVVAAVEERSPDAVVLVDETYRPAAHGDTPTPASAATLSPRIVTCSSLSKAHGAPGLRVGWLTTADPDRYERLRQAKFLTAVSCSPLDEALGAAILRRQTEILAPRAKQLGQALAELRAWAADRPVDLVVPDAGALCCLRLRDGDPADFHARLAALDTRVAAGPWFHDDARVFRVGFGHLPPDDFTEALTRLGDAVAR